MFEEIFDKLSTFANHHQIIIALLVGFFLICLSWGVEKILETFFFPNNPKVGYIVAIVGALFFLWLIQHFILHVV